MKDAFVTVFTPTYNRGYTIGRLYDSLLRQTDKRFCWIIVNDGSTDNTEELILDWIKEKRIDIQYYKQKNQGKPSAHNKGVELTRTELFTCVDSDDYLKDNAIEEIITAWQNHPDDCIGILGYREREKESLQAVVTIRSIKEHCGICMITVYPEILF